MDEEEITTLFGTYKVAYYSGDTKYSSWMDDFKKERKFRVKQTTRVTEYSHGTTCESSCGVEYQKYSPYKYC